ncbi:MAG: hypothetical protein AB7P25_16660 [Dehalococcoidia bacterium]
MRHDTARELLPLHAIGVVNASEAAEVSRHIATCRQCGQEAEIYAFGAAALDAIAGADPAVLHSSDPLPALAGPGLDRIAADVFRQLGSYAPEWPGGVADAPQAVEVAAMWGLTSEDDDTAGDLVRGIANDDSLALQDSVGFADSVTLEDIDGNRVPGLRELSGQSRGAGGWVGPGDPSITSLADEEWPLQDADVAAHRPVAPGSWPAVPARDENRADEQVLPAASDWTSEEELHDDWADLATGTAPPASALLDEATSLRTVISRLKANSGSSEQPTAQEDEVERVAPAPPGEIEPPEEGGGEVLPHAAPNETAIFAQDHAAGDGRRGLGAIFRRSRKAEPADGTWDDLFQEAEPPTAAEPGTLAPRSAPMLAGDRVQAPEVLDQPGETSRPPLPPSWLARTGTPPIGGHAPAVDDVESLDSWAELAGTASEVEAVTAPASTPESLLDDPIAPEEVDEAPAAVSAAPVPTDGPPVPSAWIAEDRPEAREAPGVQDQPDDWADLVSGEALRAETEEDAVTAADGGTTPEELGVAAEVSVPAEQLEADEDFEDDWADLLSGEALRAEAEEDEPAVPAVAEVHVTEEAVEGAAAAFLAEPDVREISAAAEIVAAADELGEDGDFEDDWADLLSGEALRAEAEDDEAAVPAAAEVPAAEEAAGAVEDEPAVPAVAEVHVTEEAVEDAAAAFLAEPDVREISAAAEIVAAADELGEDGDFEDDWADLLSAEALRAEAEEDEPAVPAVAEVHAAEEAAEAGEDAVAAVAVETAPEQLGAAAEVAVPAEQLEADEDFEDDWADLLSAEALRAEAEEDEPAVPAVAEVHATEEAAGAVEDAVAAVAVETTPEQLGAAAEVAGVEAVASVEEAASGPETSAEADRESGTVDFDDFADSWAGLALAEDDEQRVADEAFALAALEDPEGVAEEQATALLRAEATVQPESQPVARGGRGRFGFLRRGRRKDEERPAEVTGPETAAEQIEAVEPVILQAETDVAGAAGPLAEGAGTAAEESDDHGDDWSALAGAGVDHAGTIEIEGHAVEGDAPLVPEAELEVPGFDAPVREVAVAEGGAVEEAAAQVVQPSLFDYDGDAEAADVEDLVPGATASAATPARDIEVSDAVADDDVGTRQRRRFGWLRRAIPGGEDIEDDWAAAAKAAPEAPADDLDAGPPATTTAEVASEPLLGIQVEEEEPPSADAAFEDAATVLALVETQADEPLGAPVQDVKLIEATEAEPIEALAPAADDTEPDGEAPGLPAVAFDADAADEGRAPIELPSLPEAAEAVAALDLESGAADGALDELFSESEESRIDDVERDEGSRPDRSRFRWFRSKRREAEDEQEPDEWAAVAAEAAVPTETEADSDRQSAEGSDEEAVATAAEQIASPDDFAAAEGDEEERLAAALQTESEDEVRDEADRPEALERAFEEPAEDEEVPPDSMAPEVPRSASPPPSRHRLREMMRRRRSAHRASSDTEPGEPIEAADLEPEPEPAPPAVPEPEPSYLVEELEELAPADEERGRRRRGGGPGRRHVPGEREASGAQRGALRRALGRQRTTEGEEDEEAAISPWAEVLRKPERPPSAPMAGAFATPYIPGPVDWGLERYDDDEPETDDEPEVAPSSWRFWTVMFGVTTVVLFGLLIGGIVMLVNLRQESQQLEVAKDAAAVPITFSSAVDSDLYSGEGYLERERGQALLTLKGITGAEQGQQYVIWADNGTGTVTPVAWTTGRSNSTTQYIPLNRVPRDVQRLYITLETFSGRPEAPPLGEILLEATTP